MSQESETEIVSTTESMMSENNYNDLELSELFNELKESTTKVETETDEFTKLKNRVDNLPKITSNLEKTLQTKTKDVVKINDPIVIKQKKEEETDSGKEWFNMKQPELTDSIKRDMLIIKNRSALDPKRHYKKEKWEIPKFFHMGTIIEGNTEFYTRLNKKQRGKNLVDEILHDDDSQKYFKRRYNEIQQQKVSGGKNHFKKVKSMRKKF
ncbi:rRNA-processing protein Fcf2p [[Candida] jaroonii]|uniref:rRNA-processing protein Fcf2p n=1 Tax=[Candida] jaroonii TaxID=467808 RepID=A0ACA9YAE9_9ASCO|nr:rRNA-processing protein Fcf2p [[Candida] jaroonii]